MNGNVEQCITNNDRIFGCPVIYTNTIHMAILFIDTPQCIIQQCHSSIGKHYLTIIASNGAANCNLINLSPREIRHFTITIHTKDCNVNDVLQIGTFSCVLIGCAVTMVMD